MLARPFDKDKNDRDYEKYSKIKDISWIKIALPMLVQNRDGYVERMMAVDKLSFIHDRSEVEIMYLFANGEPPSQWKKKDVVNYSLNRQIHYATEQSYQHVLDADIVMSNVYKFLRIFAPDFVERQLVDTWQEAQIRDCLGDYFHGHDYLDVFSGTKYNDMCSYSGDYESYLTSVYSKRQLAEIYVSYLQRNNQSVPLSKNSYSNCLNNVTMTLKQASMYQEIVREIDGIIDILSDGAGTLSLACINIGKEYNSEEPNDIGLVARKLGIIGGLFDISHTLIVANSIEFERNQLVAKNYNRVLIIEEGNLKDPSSIAGYESVPYTTGQLWQKGFKLNYFNPLYTRVVDYIRSKEPVRPYDIKSREFCVENEIKIDKKGFKIATTNVVGAYNIATRQFPSKIRRAKLGDIKEIDGVFFDYDVPGQQLNFKNKGISYYPIDLQNKIVLFPELYEKIGDLYRAEVSNPRSTRFIYDKGKMNVAYYIFSKIVKKKKLSYYSISGFRVKVDIEDIPLMEATVTPDPIKNLISDLY